jgi:hypothetical protein
MKIVQDIQGWSGTLFTGTINIPEQVIFTEEIVQDIHQMVWEMIHRYHKYPRTLQDGLGHYSQEP